MRQRDPRGFRVPWVVLITMMSSILVGVGGLYVKLDYMDRSITELKTDMKEVRKDLIEIKSELKYIDGRVTKLESK